MARPVTIDNVRVLQVARRLFLKNGYKAGTKQIAGEADISEASLFKHFGTKPALFLAAMGNDDGHPPPKDMFLTMVGNGDIRDNLERIGLAILSHIQVMLPRLLMLNASGMMLEAARLPNTDGVPHPIRQMKMVADYFKAEVKAGRLKMANPRITAQIFIGTLVHYVVQEKVFDFRCARPRDYVKTVADMILATSECGGTRTGGRRL
jgi:AcrR family transcriptional regulator